MLQILFISSVLAISYARPNYGNYGESRNVVTVPTNCPPGQEWIDGQCRDVWRSVVTPPSLYWGNPVYSPNVITVPPNCPPGQEYINGQCRDVWRGSNVPNSNVYNQVLEKLWRDHMQKLQQSYNSVSSRNYL